MKAAILFGTMALIAAPAVMADSLPVVAVAEFRNETSAGWWGGGVGDDLADMLANELAATEAFRVVERKKLNAVLDEQDLADSGRINRATGAQIGKVTGAQYLVIGTVSAWEENTRGSGGGISYRGIGIGGARKDAYMAIDIRVVDTTTGEVVHTRTIEGRSGGWGLNVRGYRHGFGGELAKHDNTPAGKAIRAALIEATDYLACVMVDQDGCEGEYRAKEKGRRERTKGAISLD